MIRNILGFIAGLVIGGIVNMGIVMIGPMIIPVPPGVDTTTVEGLQAGMHLLEPKHFITPFVAHAAGTLVGAFIATLITTSRKFIFALAIGVLFLLGGISAAYMIPAPTWFIALDLLVAYIPMAWIGGKLGGAGESA